MESSAFRSPHILRDVSMGQKWGLVYIGNIILENNGVKRDAADSVSFGRCVYVLAKG